MVVFVLVFPGSLSYVTARTLAGVCTCLLIHEEKDGLLAFEDTGQSKTVL